MDQALALPTLHCPSSEARSFICRLTVLTDPEITEVGESRQELKSPLPATLPSMMAFSAFRSPSTEAFWPMGEASFGIDVSGDRSMENKIGGTIQITLDLDVAG
jgi:hypothetical protein